jgi:hypothetical protein
MPPSFLNGTGSGAAVNRDQTAGIIFAIGVLAVTGIVALRGVTHTCGYRGRPCRPSVQHAPPVNPDPMLDELWRMDQYWLARTNPRAAVYLDAGAFCRWEPRYEGFIQRGLTRAKEMGVAPVDLPASEVSALSDACLKTTCIQDGPVDLPMPLPWKRPPTGNDPGECWRKLM